MPKEVPQSIRDVQEDEHWARILYLCIRESAILAPIVQSLLFAYAALEKTNPIDLVAAGAAVSGTPLIKTISDRFEKRYERQKEEGIRNLPELEPDKVVQLIPRT